MSYPDPQNNPGQQPGPAHNPGGYQPTRPLDRSDLSGPGAGSAADGYQIDYSQGGYPAGGVPPAGPPPGDYPGYGGGPGGGDGGNNGGGNKKALWIAAAAILFVLVLAGIVIGVATTGSSEESTAATSPPTTTTTAPALPSMGGFEIPSEIPTGISIPPIFGEGETTGPDAREWAVTVTGSGSAQLSTVGVPDTGIFGSEDLPWNQTFTSDAPLVMVTVVSYEGDVSCSISRDGEVVSEQSSSDSSGPVICTASR